MKLFSTTSILVLITVLTIFVFIFRLTSTATNPANSVEKHQTDISSQSSSSSSSSEFSIPRATRRKDWQQKSAINKNKRRQPLLNGVILYLYGGRWNDYFVNSALPRLDEYFLSCYPYPVIVFHEGATDKEKQGIIRALPKGQQAFSAWNSASSVPSSWSSTTTKSLVAFDDVSSVWKNLPRQISEEKLKLWLSDPVQRKFQGRGYRIMCRFWHGLVWLRSSLDEFEYYWRLDTDSILTRPVVIDPFVLVFKQQKCVYGFNRLKGENPHVSTGLFETFKKFLTSEVDSGFLNEKEHDECIRFVTVRSDGGKTSVPSSAVGGASWWAPMYYNNFEMGTLELKRSEPYQRFFRWVDENEPFGIFRYRWGDAPLHTLGILVAQKCSIEKFCNVTFSQVPYRHAVTKIPPLLQRVDKC